MIRNEEGKGEKIQTHLPALVGFRASPDHHRSSVARDANRNAQDESSKGQRKSPCVQPSRTRSESTGQWRHRRFRGDRIACVHDGATPWARLASGECSPVQPSSFAGSQQPSLFEFRNSDMFRYKRIPNALTLKPSCGLCWIRLRSFGLGRNFVD